MSNFLNWTDEQIEDLINDVYEGKVTRKKLPKALYEAILLRLTQAVVDGFGVFGDSPAHSTLLSSFESNMAIFSAAKTFQQVHDMSNFITNDAGVKRPFSDFKKNADDIFGVYNNAWLETEFNTAFSLSQSGSQWLDIQETKDTLPLLRYSTVGDERVRDEHAELDDITLEVDDPFWDTFFPPNNFNCRCIAEQIDEGEITDLKSRKIENPPKLFSMNAGKDKVIFDEKSHPYFKVDKRYKVLKKDNFGL